jgi:retron-type reverse transcriptase
MKRIGNLYATITTFENLLIAHKKARKGTKSNQENMAFGFHLEKELFRLQNELITQTYKPSGYQHFIINDSKRRKISVATFRDRVIHHALINVLNPIYEKRFYAHSYATRKNKGTHKAILQGQHYLRLNQWYYKADIAKFFDSIDHQTLLSIIQRKIKDPKVIWLIRQIVYSGGEKGKGLPIGNLTSQFFANVYLNELDTFIKSELQVKHYIRYMDDFVLFSDDKDQLKYWRKRITTFLLETLQLKINPPHSFLNNVHHGLRFLGANIYRNTIRIKKSTLKRVLAHIKEREEEYETGKIDEPTFKAAMNSLWAFLAYFDTFQLRKKWLSS